MKNDPHVKKSNSNSAFFWGFLFGAIFATLLTTKKGRAILREIINTGMELIEDFIEDRKDKMHQDSVIKAQKVIQEEEAENVADATSDLKSEVSGVEEAPVAAKSSSEPAVDEVSEEAEELAMDMEEEDVEPAEKRAKRGSKRRLFKGIRKSKPN